MYKLTSDLRQKLINLPETGMGYQIVDAKFNDWSTKECIVINSSIIEPTNNRSVGELFKAFLNEDLNYFEKSERASSTIIDVNLKTRSNIILKGFLNEQKSTGTGADKQPETETKLNEQFIRFSHFENDNRINQANWSVVPGTYATTYDDAVYCIKNKINPISRYALPNTLAIEYAFHIHPLTGTKLKRGIVEPANNQIGGGLEVIFTKGTTANTVVKVEKL
jgi:hypothetical protein